ncbi:nucleotidyltransferase domain-containing protein [Cellulomonas cellasea]|nr:nucleotidyltransferase domain-containing protein [Cellulomonas cellasea]
MGDGEDRRQQREVDSDMRLAQLAQALEGAIAGKQDGRTSGTPVEIGDMTIFCAGSFARGEGSPHSDIDLFFAYPDDGAAPDLPRTNELKLFGRLIDVVDELGFPPFSRDAMYLESVRTNSLMPHLGGPKDDDTNFFTLRMLMLLESRCLVGRESYNAIVSQILDWYFYDAPKHEEDFEPWALYNDIIRYWRTMLLNYENANFRKRGAPEGERADEAERQAERRARKFKLSFSRATTCFATIAAIAAAERPATKQSITELVAISPMARLQTVPRSVPATAPIVNLLTHDYEWFLSQTAQSKADLHAAMSDDESRKGLSERARVYGDRLYELLCAIDSNRTSGARGLVRYLVV